MMQKTRHCEKPGREAIQGGAQYALDGFAALATTNEGPR